IEIKRYMYKCATIGVGENLQGRGGRRIEVEVDSDETEMGRLIVVEKRLGGLVQVAENQGCASSELRAEERLVHRVVSRFPAVGMVAVVADELGKPRA